MNSYNLYSSSIHTGMTQENKFAMLCIAHSRCNQHWSRL